MAEYKIKIKVKRKNYRISNFEKVLIVGRIANTALQRIYCLFIEIKRLETKSNLESKDLLFQIGGEVK